MATLVVACTAPEKQADSVDIAAADEIAFATTAPRDTGCAVGEPYPDPPPDESPAKITQDLPAAQTVECRIRDGQPPVRLTLVADTAYDFVKELTVEGPATTQVITAVDAEAPPLWTRYFFALDFDGDGYRDLALMSFWGATGNRGYDVYRYDSTSSRFVRDSLLSAEGNPDPEPGRRCVRSHSVGGMAGGIRREATHCWLQGRWVITRLENQDWSDSLGAFLRVVRQRRGDSLVRVRVDTIRDSTFR